MKSRMLFALIFSLAITNSSLAQVDPNSKLKKDLQRYKNMKNGGTAMVVVGSIIMFSGGVIAAKQVNDSSESPNKGVVVILSGAVVLGGGIPLAHHGRTKYRELRNSHPEIISVGIRTTPHSIGFGINVRF